MCRWYCFASESIVIAIDVFQVSLANKTHWKLWQTGMELYVENTLIFKLREISLTCLNSPYRNELNKFKIKQDGEIYIFSFFLSFFYPFIS